MFDPRDNKETSRPSQALSMKVQTFYTVFGQEVAKTGRHLTCYSRTKTAKFQIKKFFSIQKKRKKKSKGHISTATGLHQKEQQTPRLQSEGRERRKLEKFNKITEGTLPGNFPSTMLGEKTQLRMSIDEVARKENL